MASIEKRGENKYRITVSCGYDRNGKKIPKRKTVELEPNLTPKQAEKELQSLSAFFEAEVKKGNYVDSNITFGKFAYQWLAEYAEKRLERKTIHSYKMELESKIFPAIGHIKLKELKPIHLIQFFDNLTEDGVRADNKKGGYSTRTIKYQHQIISSILQTGVYWQAVPNNIARNVQPPKGIEVARKEKHFNEEQVREFLTILDSEKTKYRALAYTTLFGGLRTEDAYVKHGLKFFEIFFLKEQADGCAPSACSFESSI